MYRIKKEFVGKVQISVNGRTIALDENTAQEDIAMISGDLNGAAFVESVPSEEKSTTKTTKK
jgi:hypothetical protein